MKTMKEKRTKNNNADLNTAKEQENNFETENENNEEINTYISGNTMIADKMLEAEESKNDETKKIWKMKGARKMNL